MGFIGRGLYHTHQPKSNGVYGIPTGGIIWEVEGRGSGSKGVAYHTDSPTQVEDDLGWWSGSKGVAYHTDSPTQVEDDLGW